jgi:DNA-binding MurR/RpiR family transcriptional regulator
MAQLSVEQVIDKIAAAYDSLPRQLKRIATYIEQHRGRVMMDRVGDIAQACNVHPSAVVRFAKHFGFSGFSELQAIFRRAYTEQVAPVQSYQQRVRKLIKSNRGRLRGSEIAREFIDGSRQGLAALATGLEANAFDAAVELLVKAKTIYIAGVRVVCSGLLSRLRPAHTASGNLAGLEACIATDQQHPPEMYR